MFDFLTPQVFNALIIANMLLGVALIGWRFTADMTRELPSRGTQRYQFDEATLADDDTQPHRAQAADTSPDVQASRSAE